MNEARQKYVVLVGAAGDLARHKIVPALKTVSIPYTLIAVDRTDITYSLSDRTVKTIVGDVSTASLYSQIVGCIELIANGIPLSDLSILVYVACPPALFQFVLEQSVSAGLLEYGNERHHIVFEKPFGRNLQEAQVLQAACRRLLTLSQVIRVDHFLAKDVVHTFLYTRAANRLLQESLNNRVVSEVVITIVQQKTIGTREETYLDIGGIIPDMVQNHGMQLLALACAPLPQSWHCDDIIAAKIQFLRSLTIDSVCTSKYKGAVADTYAFLKATSSDPMWQGVALRLCIGKGMDRDETSIMYILKKPICPNDLVCSFASEEIKFFVQPHAALQLSLNVAVAPDQHRQIFFEYPYHCINPYSRKAYEYIMQELVVTGSIHSCITVSYEEIDYSWQLLQSASYAIEEPYDIGKRGPIV